jgi:hypothetical protein
MRIGWLVNEGHFVTTSPFRNSPYLPTTQCACADFGDFAKQRNGGGGREKDTVPACLIGGNRILMEPVISILHAIRRIQAIGTIFSRHPHAYAGFGGRQAIQSWLIFPYLKYTPHPPIRRSKYQS